MFKVAIKESADSWLVYITLTVSVLLHLLLIVQFNSSMAGSSASAPTYDTRVSLNLLPPETRSDTQSVRPEIIKKTGHVKVEQKPEPEAAPAEQLASAPHIAEKVQRETAMTEPMRQRYLVDLLTHIEGHKYYPRSAQRRGIQGSINVSFRLLGDGSIEGLDVSGEPALLRHAAKGAVTKALPLPPPPEEIGAPIQISYAMQYQLE